MFILLPRQCHVLSRGMFMHLYMLVCYYTTWLILWCLRRMPLTRHLFVFVFEQKFMKGCPDLCSEMNCQRVGGACTDTGGMSRVVVDRRLHPHRITATTATTVSARDVSTEVGLCPEGRYQHGHTSSMLVPLPAACTYTATWMTRPCDTGSEAFLLPRATSPPFFPAPSCSTQYESNGFMEESIRRQQEMHNINDTMLRIIDQEKKFLQQLLDRRYHRLLLMELVLSSNTNNHMSMYEWAWFRGKWTSNVRCQPNSGEANLTILNRNLRVLEPSYHTLCHTMRVPYYHTLPYMK